MPGPGGVKAFSIFGEIGLPGMPTALTQLAAFERAGRRAATGLIPLNNRALLVGGAIAGIGAFAIGSSISAFARFDEKMTSSLAIMGDVSDAMRKDMADAARTMARQSVFSAEQAAESYYFLASAGLNAQQALAAMPTVTKFAQAGMFDMALATDLLTDAQSALGYTIRNDTVRNIENMTRVADVLVKAGTLANATVQQFSESLTNRAGAALKLVNKDVEEGVAVLAAMADQGVKGAEAGVRLDIVMRELQRRAIENADEFKRQNIAVFDSTNTMRNMADIVGDMERAFDGMSDATKRATIMQLGFSARSVAAVLALLGTSDAIRNYEIQLRDAAGTMEEVSERQMKTLTRQWGLLKSNIRDVSIGLGESIVPAVNTAVGAFQGLLNVLRDVDDWIDRLAEKDVLHVRRFFEGLGEDIDVNAPRRQANAEIRAMRRRALTAEQRSVRAAAGMAMIPGLPSIPYDFAVQQAEATAAQIEEIALDELRTRVQIGEASKQDLIARLDAEIAAQSASEEELREMRIERYGLQKELDDEAQKRNEDRLTAQDAAQQRVWEAERQRVLDEWTLREQMRDFELQTGQITFDERIRQLQEIANRQGASEALRQQMMQRTFGVARTGTQEAINDARALAETNKEAAIDMLNAHLATLEALGVAYPALADEIRDAIDEIRSDTVATMGDVGQQAGGQVIAGMMSGIMAGRVDLKRVMMQVIQFAIMRVITSQLGIFSPSRVAMEWGKNITQGIALGMLSEQTTLATASDTIASAALGGLRGGTLRAGFTSRIDVSRLPPPTDPRQAARDNDWLVFLNESEMNARALGMEIN